MELNATILNSSDKVLMRFVALGEGDVSIYKNLKKAPQGSTYLDQLNKAFYQKMGNSGESADWVKLTKDAPSKAAVFGMPADEVVLERSVYAFQENVEVGTDDVVRGKLKYVSGWESFSDKPEEQSGHYLSLLIPRPFGTTEVRVQKDAEEEKVMKSDNIVVLVKDSTKSLKFTVSTDSGTFTRTLDLSKLEKL